MPNFYIEYGEVHLDYNDLYKRFSARKLVLFEFLRNGIFPPLRATVHVFSKRRGHFERIRGLSQRKKLPHRYQIVLHIALTVVKANFIHTAQLFH